MRVIRRLHGVSLRWRGEDVGYAPSVTPRRTRTAANPAKFVGAARHMHTAPHRTLLSLVISCRAIHRYPHSNRNEPCQWKSAHKIDKRALRDQLPYSVRTESLTDGSVHTEVKNRSTPGILRSLQAKIFDQSKDSCISQAQFVQIC